MSEAFHSILAVLRSDRAESETVLARASALAEDAHGLLTVAAVSYPGWWAMWLQSLAFAAAALPPVPDARDAAHDRLACAAEFVPETVGLKTLVIEGPPRRPLERLLRSGHYDLLVVGAHLARRRPLSHLPIPALIVLDEDATSPSESRRPLIQR